MSEARIKELIVKYDSANAIPRLKNKKYEGKFLKADFEMTLIDILREANENDYSALASVLEVEAEKNSGRSQKGFGAKAKG